jgi:hypothetical protein
LDSVNAPHGFERVQPDAVKRARRVGESRAQLIECLQPDRRVEIEVTGTR